MCRILQEDNHCVVRAIALTMKTKKSLEKIKRTEFEELPSVKKVLGRIKEEDGVVTYQAVEIKKFTLAKTYLKSRNVVFVIDQN